MAPPGGAARSDGAVTCSGAEAARYRRLEREWQDGVGHQLLDEPLARPGSAAVVVHQRARLVAALRTAPEGPIVEVGCGKGHFLDQLARARGGAGGLLVGVDVSRAVERLPAQGFAGIKADGEALPLRDASVGAVVYDGALHHVIDYPTAVREAVRVLVRGGLLLIHEPVTSWFSRLAHRLLDPIVFRKCVYESPIDIHFKHAFREKVILRVLREEGLAVERVRTDFLAYPLTGCYASSPFARNEKLMRRLLALEERLAALPVAGAVLRQFAWRFTVAARKPRLGG